MPTTAIIIREAGDDDRSFIMGLSPSLAGVADLAWQTDNVVQEFQDNYIVEMLDQTDGPQITLIAEKEGVSIGFIHAREMTDEISGELCGTVPLLAVSEKTRGTGVGKMLLQAAEDWAKAQGYRLLHLEVFANNSSARVFYEKQGFKPETLVMIKSLD